jgi:propionyl-CoA carboxylase beta chain
MDLAVKIGAPVIGLNDSGGARIQEGVESLAGYADIFLRNTLASGVVPQISGDHGPVRGGRRVFARHHRLRRDGRAHELHVHHRPGGHQDGDQRGGHQGDLGGATTHATKSGVCHLTAPDDRARHRHACASCSRSCPRTTPKIRRGDARRPDDREVPELDTMVPSRVEQAVRHQERHPRGRRRRDSSRSTSGYARNMVVGFARIGGRPVGVVANQPQVLAGCLDIEASIKGARFVRFCDCFNIPLVTFVDVPASSRAPTRSTAASSRTARSCSTPSPRPPCRSSRSSRARPTAARTT